VRMRTKEKGSIAENTTPLVNVQAIR